MRPHLRMHLPPTAQCRSTARPHCGCEPLYSMDFSGQEYTSVLYRTSHSTVVSEFYSNRMDQNSQRHLDQSSANNLRERMVERSDLVIAVYDGREKGGTVGTIRRAHTMKKELREILNALQHLMQYK